MFARDLKLMTRMMTGFGAVLLLVVMYATYVIQNLDDLGEATDHFYQEPFTVSIAARGLRGRIVALQRDMHELVVVDTADEVEASLRSMAGDEAEGMDYLRSVQALYRGPQEDMARLSQGLALWQYYRGELVSLVQAGKQKEAIAYVQGNAGRHMEQLEHVAERVVNVALGEAKEFHDRTVTRSEAVVTATLWSLAGLFLTALAIALVITRSVTRPLTQIEGCMGRLAGGEHDVAIPFLESDNELGSMARALGVFQRATQKMAGQHWVKSSLSRLGDRMQRADVVRDLAQIVIEELTPTLEGGHGVIHVWNDSSQRLELAGTYGFRERKNVGNAFALGEGLIGQCALEKAPITLTSVPDDYVRIASGLGEAKPLVISVAPVIAKDRVLAVIEIATFAPLNEERQALFDGVLPLLALNLEILERSHKTRGLLERSQQQAEELRASEEELQAQSEELREANLRLAEKSESLERQTLALMASEEGLKNQREELQAANEELSEKTSALEERQQALETARREAEQKAFELNLASRYKSEFLANMSHELRTPLNSLLILAKNLFDNEEGNLNQDQIESAQVIHDSGTHLLNLINDILDLSKVEAGRMNLMPEDLRLTEIADGMAGRFRHMAKAKGLTFSVEVAGGLPEAIRADPGKLEQIVNNLAGNALKFTTSGGVTIRLSRPEGGAGANALVANSLAIAVIDTGVGIPPDKLERIFQAFEQVDGTTARRFGGTGLGLTISRKLARLMGGDIVVSSIEGEGSTFTLHLPWVMPDAAAPTPPPPAAASLTGIGTAARTPAEPPPVVTPPSSTFVPPPGPTPPGASGSRTLLIIEDDPAFAKILAGMARDKGFNPVAVHDGEAGLLYAGENRLAGIVLDIGLPGLDGWQVLERLRASPATCHVPVHIISAGSDDQGRGAALGSLGFLKKPASKDQIAGLLERIGTLTPSSVRRVLVVDDEPQARTAVAMLIGGEAIDVVEAGTGTEALARLATESFDCIVLDLRLPDMSGLELLERLTSECGGGLPPVVIHTGRELSRDETVALREYTDSIILKGPRSPERLLNEVTLFLHSVRAALPPSPPAAAGPATPNKAGALINRTVLVVDDDMRNAFALSKVLRARGLKVLLAQDGRKALTQLADHPEVELVLTDIMMPEMDGYEVIRAIRRQPRGRRLPVLALTAKAMIGDEAKCLEAGADGYLSKPIDIDRLLDLMRSVLRPETVGDAGGGDGQPG